MRAPHSEEEKILFDEYRHAEKAWELLHEEEGFEDIGTPEGFNISDIDGAETHMHFLEKDPRDIE